MCFKKTLKTKKNSVTDFSYCLGLFKQMGMTNTDKYNTNYNNLQYMRTADKKCAPQFWNYNGILFFLKFDPCVNGTLSVNKIWHAYFFEEL